MPLCVACGAEAKVGRKHCSLTCYRVVQRSTPIADRFWPKVRTTDTCWLWTSTINHKTGYGMLGGPRVPNAEGRLVCRPLYAHRVAWELAHGPIPPGQWVLHHCDVPACVNPDHLFLGTQRDNVRDAAAKGRLHVARPGRHKVTSEQLPEIDRALAAGERQRDIAARFGVSQVWVSLYVRGLRRQFDRRSA